MVKQSFRKAGYVLKYTGSDGWVAWGTAAGRMKEGLENMKTKIADLKN